MYGFYNLLLKIDVTAQTFEREELPDDLLEKYLGGKGLATHLLLQRNPPGVEPLAPENHLIFTTGPVAATKVWGSCRYGVFTKSPQTGFYAESYSGGTVAEYIAATGFDAIDISGRSEEPLWIEISDDTIHFHPAKELWGLDTYETEDRIKAWISENRPDSPKCGVSVVGPAAENGVSFALIENDYWRSAGRTGAGAVMGAKNIKAIAFYGKARAEAADQEAVTAFSREIAQRSRTDAGVKAYKTYGTTMMVDLLNKVKAFPTRYWSKGQVDHREKINAAALQEKCTVKAHACRKCLMACGRLSTVKEGKHEGLTVEGPEYETIYAFGGLCEIDNIEDILYLNDVCDRLGMDTITAGNLAGLAIEAARQGRIDLDIDYGDTEAVVELLYGIAYRRGHGNTLADGIKTAAEEWNMTDQAIHVKGLEPAGYDPRVLKGMGLAYGTSDRGACHLRATFYKPEIAGLIDPDQIEGKSEMFTEWEDRLTFFDALILCRFYRDMYQWQELAAMTKATTGLDLTDGEMQAIAQRITDDTRLFNLREGLTPADDKLPKRFSQEMLPEAGKVISEEEMQLLLQNYYRARGWDENGVPIDSTAA
ncbi:MAG: aldehyde:ferredoxin oxidoreductase [Deltaproteobacteria bacterium]|nr:MAG: aldehyde:ferredoxin oxidoreductase [Deltaproteobacteria bacterium]